MQDPEDTRTVIARFRYSVIAPLVVRALDKGEQAHLLADLASRLWPAPDGSTIHIHRRTLTRWLARYRQKGFSGLMPEPRTDRGARPASPTTSSPALPICVSKTPGAR